jgi:cell wall-associated NlpC family hydrolase
MDKRALMDVLSAYRARLTRTIEPWLGTPYLFGGTTRRVGVDCSGFARGVFQEGFDLLLPRVSRDQFMVGQSVPREALQPGDLVFFDMKESGRVSHVGVYAGDGRFAHASLSRGVVYADFGAATYRRTYRGGRRILAYPAANSGSRARAP